MIKKSLLIVLFALSFNSCFGMEYVKECATELKANAQEFWSNANCLTKTAVVLSLGGATSYVLLNEWRHKQKNIHIKKLEEIKLVVAALAYGGFNTSFNAILRKVREDEQTASKEVLFESKLGLGDYYPETHTFVTEMITQKMKGRLFNHVRLPGDLLRDELIEKHRRLKKRVATLYISLFDVYPKHSHLTNLKNATYPDHFSLDELQDTQVPKIIKKLRKKFYRTQFNDEASEEYEEKESSENEEGWGSYNEEDEEGDSHNEENQQNKTEIFRDEKIDAEKISNIRKEIVDNILKELEVPLKRLDIIHNTLFGKEYSTDYSREDSFYDEEYYEEHRKIVRKTLFGRGHEVFNSEKAEDNSRHKEEIITNLPSALEDRVTQVEKRVDHIDTVFFQKATFKPEPEENASVHDKTAYYEELRDQAWNSIAWNKHKYTIKIAMDVYTYFEKEKTSREEKSHLLI